MNSTVPNSFLNRYPTIAYLGRRGTRGELIQSLLREKGHKVFEIPLDEPMEYRLLDFRPELILIDGIEALKAWQETRDLNKELTSISSARLPMEIAPFEFYESLESLIE